ncbi:MAG: endonuclease/exonuclease/phosphatase family protein [Sphingomonadales bacterium]|jgi:hypothetical protein
MCVINLTIETYNTHLFGDMIGKLSGQEFGDDERKSAIRSYFASRNTSPSDLYVLGLQEVWDGNYADNFVSYFKDNGIYAYHCWPDNLLNKIEREAGFNQSGLILFGSPRFSDFDKKDYYDYILRCGPSWSGQDLPTGKGYVFTQAKYVCPDNPDVEHRIGLMNTHMPTNYSDFKSSVTCCFKSSGERLRQFRGKNHHPDSAVFLMGDFNASTDAEKYSELVVPYYLDDAGMTIVDPSTDMVCNCDDPSASNGTVSICNNTWRHFNPDKDSQCTRPDHIFYASSSDGKMTVTPTGHEMILTEELASFDGGTYCCSDHYGIKASFTIEVDHD